MAPHVCAYVSGLLDGLMFGVHWRMMQLRCGVNAACRASALRLPRRKRYKKSPSFLSIHMGVRAEALPDTTECHHIIVEDWARMEEPFGTLFVSIPTLLDPSISPPGTHIVHIFSPDWIENWQVRGHPQVVGQQHERGVRAGSRPAWPIGPPMSVPVFCAARWADCLNRRHVRVGAALGFTGHGPEGLRGEEGGGGRRPGGPRGGVPAGPRRGRRVPGGGHAADPPPLPGARGRQLRAHPRAPPARHAGHALQPHRDQGAPAGSNSMLGMPLNCTAIRARRWLKSMLGMPFKRTAIRARGWRKRAPLCAPVAPGGLCLARRSALLTPSHHACAWDSWCAVPCRAWNFWDAYFSARSVMCCVTSAWRVCKPGVASKEQHQLGCQICRSWGDAARYLTASAGCGAGPVLRRRQHVPRAGRKRGGLLRVWLRAPRAVRPGQAAGHPWA